VAFAERMRAIPQDMAPRELTLNLSTYHRTAAIHNPAYRPNTHISRQSIGCAFWIRRDSAELASFRILIHSLMAFRDTLPWWLRRNSQRAKPFSFAHGTKWRRLAAHAPALVK
jgi:hypothetical protein